MRPVHRRRDDGGSGRDRRAWLAVHAGHWLTPGRKRALTGVLIAAGVLGAGVVGPAP